MIFVSCEDKNAKSFSVRPLVNEKTLPQEIHELGHSHRRYEIKNFELVDIQLYEYRFGGEKTLLYETSVSKNDIDGDKVVVTISQDNAWLPYYRYYVTISTKERIKTSFAMHQAYPQLLEGLIHHSIDYSGLESSIPVKNNEPYTLSFSTFSKNADLMSGVTFWLENIDDAMYEDLQHEGVVVIAVVIEVQDNDEDDHK